jgi:hypothetical protein
MTGPSGNAGAAVIPEALARAHPRPDDGGLAGRAGALQGPVDHVQRRRRDPADPAIGLRDGESAQAVLGHSELSSTQVNAEKSLETARAVMRQIG